MSEKHTQRRLHTGGDGTIIYDAQGWGVANATVYHGRQEPGTARENARRLVACWNLCEIVPTENIEELSAYGLFRVLAQTELYKMQRDELVAICQSVLDRGIGASDLAAMRSAIAKVKGGAA